MSTETWVLGQERVTLTQGRPSRLRCEAVAVCRRCGKEFPLIAETEVWTEPDAGVNEALRAVGKPPVWEHAEYGPAQGACCGLLIVDSFEGCFEYDLSRGRKGDA